jgi:hypothetical protein
MSFLDFENFLNESAGFAFQEDVHLYSRGSNRSNLSFYNQPQKFKDVSDADGRIYFNLKPTVKKGGIEDFQATKVTVVLDIQTTVWNEEKEWDDYENEVVQWSTDKVNLNLEKLPFYIEEIEVDMKKSDDPKKWEITLNIGSRD